MSNDGTVSFNNVRGIVAILIATIFGTACDVVTRLALEQGYPLTEVLSVRGALTLLWLATLIVAVGAWRKIALLASPLVFVRSIFDTCHVVFVVAAISTIPLAIAIAGLTTLPIWLTLISALLLKEKVGWRRWLAVLVGFCGMFLIVKPDASAFNYFTLIAIASGLAAAARDIVTPRVHKELSPWLLTSVSVVMITGATFPMTLSGHWQPVTPYVLLLLVAGGLFQICSMYWIITGFRAGEISVIAPFRFVLLIWALLAGYLIFGEIVDMQSLLGVLLIVVAGVYTLWREAAVRKKRATAAFAHSAAFAPPDAQTIAKMPRP